MELEKLIIQTAGDGIANLPEGQALLYVGIFLSLTLIVMKLRSAISLFTWALSGVFLVMTLIGLVSAIFYWGVMALAFVGSTASTIYTISNP